MRFTLIVIVLVLLGGCASSGPHPGKEVTAETSPDGVQHVRLTAHSFYFEPNRIVVKAHVPVEVAIHNAAFLTPHNFTIVAPDAGMQVKRGLSWFGGTRKSRFIPTQPGEYPFFCSVDKHSTKGMTGTLVVVE